MEVWQDSGTAERFWAKVDKTGDCWMWTGTQNGRGYGSLLCRTPLPVLKQGFVDPRNGEMLATD